MPCRDQVVQRTLCCIAACLSCLGGASAQQLDRAAQAAESATVGGGERIAIADAQVSLIQNTFIATPIAGLVAEVSVAEGDRVEAGSRLVQLDAQQTQTELEAAQAAYEAARLQSDNDVDARYAKRTLEVRQRELQQSLIANEQFPGSISQTEISKLQLVVDQSRLAIEQAEHEMQVASAGAREKLAAAKIVEARLDRHRVLAPVSGIAVEVAVEPGEWVEVGKPVVRIISLDPIRVECFVDGRQHGAELVGGAVEFFPTQADINGDTAAPPLRGKVSFVSPELNPVTGQARLWATIENPGLSARAGMLGRIVIAPP
jgi:macrolide-specific efflux system membrane fusion protein